ncbi:dihydroneopterin aldolase [Sinimarinibacterium sp. CAU 1509]|uniref:dihydroneopterin aldolase n=1 Tax=Sinimarinibacterium sp. CAU 1509 TaxID=2562283 RepID=UPI0010ACD460|nr:dihydroneopterin aldolase [Sinimarinibacterium sp. CAU 1509]TJY59879.1 dihydroneopterin aldolase [Sinimarinibacterium sp. CAU 1509]
MDTVFLQGLEVEAIIGVYGWERQLPRPLIFDLALGVNTREAASSDHVRDAVDYAAVAERVSAITRELQPALLETLVETIARRLFDEFPIQQLQISVNKPGAVAKVKAVGVRIERRREDYAACGR